jgi:hypothetical protein
LRADGGILMKRGFPLLPKWQILASKRVSGVWPRGRVLAAHPSDGGRGSDLSLEISSAAEVRS